MHAWPETSGEYRLRIMEARIPVSRVAAILCYFVVDICGDHCRSEVNF